MKKKTDDLSDVAKIHVVEYVISLTVNIKSFKICSLGFMSSHTK